MVRWARDARSEVKELPRRRHPRLPPHAARARDRMGAIDLVVQIEAPPSVASGLQRIGRAGHQVGAEARRPAFPKLATTSPARRMRGCTGGKLKARAILAIRSTFSPSTSSRWSDGPWGVDEIYAPVRQAAPLADLSRRVFEGVLDAVRRYPSDEFAEPVRANMGSRQGHDYRTHQRETTGSRTPETIPTVASWRFAGADRPMRVGELDEEMIPDRGRRHVHAGARRGAEEITHDRVLVYSYRVSQARCCSAQGPGR